MLTGFGRHRHNVSTIAAITVARVRRRLGQYWRTDPDSYIDAAAVVAFPRGLPRRLRDRVIVIWDGGSNHKGPAIRELLRKFLRLHLERLPGYAPDLNPVEMIWAYLKHGRLANFVPQHVTHLDRVIVDHLTELRGGAGPDPVALGGLETAVP